MELKHPSTVVRMTDAKTTLRRRCASCLWQGGVMRDQCEHGSVFAVRGERRIPTEFARSDGRVCGPSASNWEAAAP